MQASISDSATAFAAALARLSEGQLVAALPDQPDEGTPWFGYVHDARNLSLFLNLQLNRLTSEMRGANHTSRATEICRQHHRAYRDLTGALAGIDESLSDIVPAPDEWPLRTIIRHITGAELGFSLLIDWAVTRQAGGDDLPITMPLEEAEPHYADYPETGTMAEVMGRYEELHRRVVASCMALEDGQLDALNVWWEDYEVPVWYRMHRFDAHLREHCIQVDKTLAALDRAPTEAERLARLLHQSLADLEIELVAPDGEGQSRSASLAVDFDARREQLAQL